ncbi:MAG: hypothetical protein ACJ79W_20420 [Myxococcales bacterium]
MHTLLPTGEAPLLGRVIPGVSPSVPLNGIAYASLPAGDVVYVNDNTIPNMVSFYRVRPDGLLDFIDSYPTGDYANSSLIAAPHLALAGHRLFALNSKGIGVTAPSTVSVFDIGPDGTLSLTPGSPFSLGTTSTSIAVAPAGDVLYAGGSAGDVLSFSVAADGALSQITHVQVLTGVGRPNGLAVDPSNRWLAFSIAGTGRVIVVDTATLQPIVDGIVVDSITAIPNSPPWIPAGLVFDSAGDLFVGHTGGYPIISVYRVKVPLPPPIVSCVGSPDAPLILEADPSACSVSISAASGVAGSCADGGGGLATCTVDGAASIGLAPGLHSIALRATSPAGAAAECTSFVNVVDRTPPVVTVAVNPSILWPPDHKLREIDLIASAVDACDGARPLTCNATSSEADVQGEPDVVWSDSRLRLRAERNGDGAGRVYDVRCSAADLAGNQAASSAQVLVPHDQR